MKAQQALDEIEQISPEQLKIVYLMFKEFLEITTDGFIAIDQTNRIIEISRSYADWLGVPPEQAKTQQIEELVFNSRLPVVRDMGGFELDKPFRFEHGKHKGKITVCSRSVVPYNGHVLGVSHVRLPEKSLEMYKVFENAYNELEYYKEEYKRTQQEYSFDSMIGGSARFLEIKKQARKAASLDSTILLLGETGTGKEVFAQSIHNESPRSANPFICVNCAAIPSELLESELFGYAAGAFSGASAKGKMGKIELAHTGTLFLDEIGDMSLPMQAKILRTLQDKEIERLGSNKKRKIDTRIIAATNVNLEQKIKNNLFREDLYYRINTIVLEIPPLRERKDDIMYFAEYFLSIFNNKYKNDKRLSGSIKNIIEHYSWPGNIRELKNTIEWAFNFSDSNAIEDKDLPNKIFFQAKASYNDGIKEKRSSLSAMVEEIEREIIQAAIDRHKGNCGEAARELGIHKTTLYRKMNR